MAGRIIGNHGLYGYYDRFWEKNPANPGVFEDEHPEYFAQGYKGRPCNMCYTNPALIAQVVKDACTYFKTGKNPGLLAGKDWISVEPMDCGDFCKCDACRAWLPKVAVKKKDNITENFVNARHSNYIFQFANAVQKEVSKECPDGHVLLCAYASHGFPPSFPVDPKIYVSLCVHTRLWLRLVIPRPLTPGSSRNSKIPVPRLLPTKPG